MSAAADVSATDRSLAFDAPVVRAEVHTVPDMVLEKPIVNMTYFLDQVQSMMA